MDLIIGLEIKVLRIGLKFASLINAVMFDVLMMLENNEFDIENLLDVSLLAGNKLSERGGPVWLET